MQNLTSDAPTPRYSGLFKAVLLVGGIYYILFAGLGFETNTELRQFIEEEAARPQADDEAAADGGI